MKKENTQHPKSHPAAKPLKKYTDAERHADMVKLIPTIVKDDPTITIESIRESLKMDHFILSNDQEIQKAIDEITDDCERSFVVMNEVMKNHGIHMDRFMLLITDHRKIKSCRRIITAGNGAKYSVTFWGKNGAVLKTWIGINMAEKYVAFGTEHICHSVANMAKLENRAELQAATIAWIISEFESDGMEMAAELITDRTVTIKSPTFDQLIVFNGFNAIATLFDGSVKTGQVDATESGIPHAGLIATLFHSHASIKSIKISCQY